MGRASAARESEAVRAGPRYREAFSIPISVNRRPIGQEKLVEIEIIAMSIQARIWTHQFVATSLPAVRDSPDADQSPVGSAAISVDKATYG